MNVSKTHDTHGRLLATQSSADFQSASYTHKRSDGVQPLILDLVTEETFLNSTKPQ